LAGKRDSFGKTLTPAVSTKAELSVLLEEEEEEFVDADTEAVPNTVTAPGPAAGPIVESPTTESHPGSTSPSGRPRPASLNFKALALASYATIALPTPSATPSPTPRPLPGMKPLNLGTGASYAARRQSMMALGSSSRSLPASRRQSLRSESRGSESPHSSRDSLGLNRLPPTPNSMSPTSMNSAATGVDGFLQKNQEVLISRIEQLEKALSKSQNRMSVASDVSSSTASSLADDQTALVTELKTERNTLVEDIAGWRTRVTDLERQAALYAKRVETERRESYTARERVRELESERCAWEADRVAQDETIARARDDAAAWRAKYEAASRGECHWQAQAVNLESDVRRLEMELATARRAQAQTATPPNKPWNFPTAPRRVDGSVSSASTTDVDEAASGEMDMWKIRPRVPSPMQNMDVLLEEEEEEVYEDSYEEPSSDGEDGPHCVEEDEDDVASDILGELLNVD
jgi:hypothetical protein